MKIKLTTIHPDGRTAEETVEGEDIALERVREIVGGWAQELPRPEVRPWRSRARAVTLRTSKYSATVIAYVNEDGRMFGLERNDPGMEATGWPADMPGHELVGNVVVAEYLT